MLKKNSIFTHIGSNKFLIKKFRKIENFPGISVKPLGGLWASDDYSWRHFVNTEFPEKKSKKSFRFVLTRTARVITISNLKDWEWFTKKYGRLVYKRDIDLKYYYFDWPLIASIFDALIVNVSNFNLLELPFELSYYDVDSIVVFNPNVVRQLG